MEGRRWSRCVRPENVLILFMTMCAFSAMVLLKVEMHRGGATVWNDYGDQTTRSSVIRQMAMPAMKTIVAYSPEKQAEMDRKYPLVCKNKMKHRRKNVQDSQWQEVPGAGVSLYSGYYDDRIPERPFLRILAVINGTESGSLYCQTWNSRSHRDAESVEAVVTPIWWKEWDPGTRMAVTPVLISCDLSESKERSFYASVSAKPCESAANVLLVETSDAKDYIRDFTVCVKDMNFSEDISDRLIEWFELLRMLGADKVDVYVSSVPLAVQDVLRYYNEIGFVTILPAPRPASSSLWQRRRDHLLAYNDCLYRNLRTSRYAVPLDVDEVIVPRGNETWGELLVRLNSLEHSPPGAASLAVSNAFFFDSFSEDAKDEGYKTKPHVLRHLWRSSLISPVPQYSKSFVSTSRALTVFNHYALNALAGAERARAVPVDMALLHHYKAACRPALVDCHQYTVETVKDDTVLRFADRLNRNINRVLDAI